MKSKCARSYVLYYKHFAEFIDKHISPYFYFTHNSYVFLSQTPTLVQSKAVST